MKGYRLNSNREYVDRIITGILKKGGHCPCRVKCDETTLCPCDEFVSTGKCACKLFLKEE